ncbi:shikimate dehydrogenase [Orrella sp. JC864]|uniref:shikimate dehydrogenase family protein n=1 Tax=Orrella sp. JC864 TaxID=3120298 RepID=UPI00300A74EA
MREITGKTALYCILADPIGHVQTPQLVNRLMREQDRDGVMVPVHVRPDDLPQMMAALRRAGNLRGMVVTVPHKMAALPLCDALEGDAAQIGAVNVVRREAGGRLVGGMLDGQGFVRGLRALGFVPAGASVYLAGAGGAASAIAFALARAGIGSLSIANRGQARYQALAERLARHHPALPVRAAGADASGHALVINATSLGMSPGDPPPLALESLDAGQWVADIIMEPAQTALLAQARRIGARTYGGLGMLQAQVADMVAFFDAGQPAQAGAHHAGPTERSMG